ncbi:siroheme synthase [Erythrobacter litoralis]|uniref:precorrin-2 dehydrogenase/sirohydrochlorin ferrochelatase family protein n=1 Tax=Erythrobacter litoralis TaxID=39960 RepID=UPI002434E82A|nr:siroheme synthase [Erythrobacter litoralis]MDG6078794.1 siroheme synthase [Erythrobacter litoralis]
MARLTDPAPLHSLPLFHRIGGKRVVVVGEGAMADAKARLVKRAGGEVCGETEAHHARLAFVALDDARQAEAAATRLRRAGLLVNVADRPDLCDFTLPSILERGDVLVAVSTGGASAGLAKHLRLRLENILPQTLGPLAHGLHALKNRLRQKLPNADDRRAALDAALGYGGPLDPLDEKSADRIDDWFSDAVKKAETEFHDFVLASDDPDDLTLRQARLLGVADTILHDANVSSRILAMARADAERGSLASIDEHRPGRTVVLRMPTPA